MICYKPVAVKKSSEDTTNTVQPADGVNSSTSSPKNSPDAADTEASSASPSTAPPNHTAENGEIIPEPTKRKMVEWRVEDSFRAMMTDKSNTYPFKLLPMEQGFRHPWEINPRLRTVMKDASTYACFFV